MHSSHAVIQIKTALIRFIPEFNKASLTRPLQSSDLQRRGCLAVGHPVHVGDCRLHYILEMNGDISLICVTVAEALSVLALAPLGRDRVLDKGGRNLLGGI